MVVFPSKIVEVPVQKQLRVPMVSHVQKSAEIPRDDPLMARVRRKAYEGREATRKQVRMPTNTQDHKPVEVSQTGVCGQAGQVPVRKRRHELGVAEAPKFGDIPRAGSVGAVVAAPVQQQVPEPPSRDGGWLLHELRPVRCCFWMQRYGQRGGQSVV